MKKLDIQYDKPNRHIQYQLPEINPSILLPSKNGVDIIDNSAININKYIQVNSLLYCLNIVINLVII